MTPKRGTLTEQEIREAARGLGCHPAALAAVAEVESGPRGAFDAEGRPTILYERHVFHRLTEGRHDDATLRFDGRLYLLSDPSPGGYGLYAHQYLKLEAARAIAPAAALMACSWGLFQIVGENHRLAGYPSIDLFVDAMETGVEYHLLAFANFISSGLIMRQALRDRDWPRFAERYNGPAYRKNKYDEKIRAAYERLSETTYKEA